MASFKLTDLYHTQPQKTTKMAPFWGVRLDKDIDARYTDGLYKRFVTNQTRVVWDTLAPRKTLHQWEHRFQLTNTLSENRKSAHSHKHNHNEVRTQFQQLLLSDFAVYRILTRLGAQLTLAHIGTRSQTHTLTFAGTWNINNKHIATLSQRTRLRATSHVSVFAVHTQLQDSINIQQSAPTVFDDGRYTHDNNSQNNTHSQTLTMPLFKTWGDSRLAKIKFFERLHPGELRLAGGLKPACFY